MTNSETTLTPILSMNATPIIGIFNDKRFIIGSAIVEKTENDTYEIFANNPKFGKIWLTTMHTSKSANNLVSSLNS